MFVCVLRPNNASTCCPIGFDHTDVDADDEDDDDEPLERGGKSGGFMLPLLLSTVIFVAPPEFDPCVDRFECPTKPIAPAPDADCPLLCSFSARNCVT